MIANIRLWDGEWLYSRVWNGFLQQLNIYAGQQAPYKDGHDNDNDNNDDWEDAMTLTVTFYVLVRSGGGLVRVALIPDQYLAVRPEFSYMLYSWPGIGQV